MRATSDQSQTIIMGFDSYFLYPVVGGSKVRGSASYQGTVVGQIVGPPGVVTDALGYGLFFSRLGYQTVSRVGEQRTVGASIAAGRSQ